eukprot:2471004-Amphidinium_carterae.1
MHINPYQIIPNNKPNHVSFHLQTPERLLFVDSRSGRYVFDRHNGCHSQIHRLASHDLGRRWAWPAGRNFVPLHNSKTLKVGAILIPTRSVKFQLILSKKSDNRISFEYQ